MSSKILFFGLFLVSLYSISNAIIFTSGPRFQGINYYGNQEQGQEGTAIIYQAADAYGNLLDKTKFQKLLANTKVLYEGGQHERTITACDKVEEGVYIKYD